VSQGLDNLRIVIVDGQKHVRSALTGFLSGLGSIVRERANADDAMTLVPRFQPDLVLSDVAMPDKDGFELLREIRSLDPSNGGKVPVIAITGLSRPQDQMRAPAAGFDAILLKPFTPDLLLKVISEMIQSRS
jgi:CheY-like chemotaxis protein